MRITVWTAVFLQLVAACGLEATDRPLTINIPEKTIQVPMMGTQVAIGVKGTARPAITADGINVVIDSEVDVSALRPLVVGLIQQQANANDDCGNKVNLHTVTVDPSGNGLLVRASGHFERWFCGYITHPVFDGWNNTVIPTPKFRSVTERIHQNKLFEQNGTIAMQLDPTVINGGGAIQLVPSIREMVADGALGVFLNTALLGDAIRGNIQNMIMSAINPNTLRFALPVDSQKYTAQWQSVRFADLGGGRLGIITEVTVAMPKEALEKFINDSIH